MRSNWLRPSDSSAPPRWGHADGMQVGIPPLPGPRGLLRVYTPYLGHAENRLVNFIAIEPIVRGDEQRGYSELEPSALDPGQNGKRLWPLDRPDDAPSEHPTGGAIEDVDGVETLTIWIGVERFDNGAEVRVRVRFRADRPHEVEVAGCATADSAPLNALVLTATMGNWARLRVLELADRSVAPAELWPGFSGTGFAGHARFPLSELRRKGDAAVVSAIGDEEDPWSVSYSADTAEHWHFLGDRARQSWIVDDPHPDLQVLVNARWAYWASASPIPGGPAYENFEILEPYREGAAYRFRVEALEH